MPLNLAALIHYNRGAPHTGVRILKSINSLPACSVIHASKSPYDLLWILDAFLARSSLHTKEQKAMTTFRVLVSTGGQARLNHVRSSRGVLRSMLPQASDLDQGFHAYKSPRSRQLSYRCADNPPSPIRLLRTNARTDNPICPYSSQSSFIEHV